MNDVFAYIDRNLDRFVEELIQLCRIPSVSAANTGLDECATAFARAFESVGIRPTIMPMQGTVSPPLLHGAYDAPAAKHTLLIYGHLDVQPAEPLGAWTSPPFEPQVRDCRLFGRGTSDNKGQLFAHLKAIEALRACGRAPPINIRFLVDPQEEIGSPLLASFVTQHAALFKADYCYIADAAAAAGGRPVVYFGNRGSCYVEVQTRTADRDVHSGGFGGPMPNAAWRLVQFVATLRNADGTVAIEGFYDDVTQPTEADLRAIAALPHDPEQWRRALGTTQEDGPSDISYFEKLLLRPTLSLCSLLAGNTERKVKTVIPCEASAKIDMRLVPDQTPQRALHLLQAHARKHAFDDVTITPYDFQYAPSKTPVDHPFGRVVASAIHDVFGVEPLLFPSSGGSNPGHILRNQLGLPTVMAPYATHDEGSHGPNENLSLDFFRKGIKTSAVLFRSLSAL